MKAADCRLYRVYRAVYSLVAPSLLTSKGRYMAAVLACGPGAVLSHRDAAALHDLRPTARTKIDVTVPGRRRVNIPGIDVHTSRTLTTTDITTIDGIPCTSVARTIADLAAVVDRRAVERAIDRAESLEILDYRRLRAVIDRNLHTRGAKVLNAIIADYDADAPTESHLEEAFFALCREAGVPLPERQVYIDPGDGEPMVRPDFVWRAQRLVVETDGGRVHRTRRAFESDRRKDQRLVLAGWRVLRITWRQITREPERIKRLIAAALRPG